MAWRKKSWREKLLDAKGLPKLGRVEGRMTRRWGTGTMVIPAPLEVDEVMKRVPKGKLVTIDAIREVLARKHGVTIACPLTTGIFAWICRPRGGRGGARRQEAGHALLAHPQGPGRDQHPVSRRRRQPPEAARGGGPSGRAEEKADVR